MPSTERFNKLKQSIDSIYEDAAKSEQERKLEEQARTKEKRQAKKKEKSEQRLADKNWKKVKRQIADGLHQANRVALGGKARISGWKVRNTGLHSHKTETESWEDEWGRTVSRYDYHDHKARIEFIQLSLRGVGQVFFFRTLRDKERTRGFDFYHFGPKLFFNNNEYRKYFCRASVAAGDRYALLGANEDKPYSLPCYHCPSTIDFSLLEPYDVEECISDALIYLHKRAIG
jgi:hypothetical protein